GVVVFSEIYYPDGWHVTIDGQPAKLARADYILRTMYVPAGEHTIEMYFDPVSLHVTEGIAYAALALLIIGVMVVIVRGKNLKKL
ncbi:YfhO family protein, partial [Bacteroides heparinolyticus]